MKPEIDIVQLVHEVEAILEGEEIKSANLGAINWGDLGVVDVEIRNSVWSPVMSGITDRVVVMIEEASPECNLPLYLHNRLREKFPGVEYECKW
jgi:hypothetical protein